MRKKLLVLSLLGLTCISLAACGGNNASKEESKQSESSQVETTSEQGTSEATSFSEFGIEKVEITNKENFLQLFVGDAGQVKASAFPSDIPQSFTFTSSNTDVCEIKKSGRFTCLAVGKTTITASCTYEGVTKEDSFEMEVKDTFFDHTQYFFYEPDFTHELDEVDPYVEYTGGGYLVYKNCCDTQWYAECTVSVNEMIAGEVWGKIGLQSVDAVCLNGLFYYVDVPLGFDGADKCWNAIGRVDEIAGNYQAEFSYELVANIPSSLMGGRNYLRYEDEFKISMLRDGADFYLYFADTILAKVTSTFLNANEASYPSFTGNNVACTVSKYSFLTSKDEGFAAKLQEAQNFGK